MIKCVQQRLQCGMALIVSLVLLLSMTLLGLAAIQNTSLQERMAGNVRSENIALQAAESALRAGEAQLEGLPTLPIADGNPVWQPADVPQGSCGDAYRPWWSCWNDGNWKAHAEVADGVSLVFVSGGNAELSGVGREPRYLIEEDGFQRSSLVTGQQQDAVNQGNRFRITARGLDAGGRGEVLLQTTFVRRF